MNIPYEITQGTTAEWTESDSDYPASDSWVGTYEIKNASTSLELTGVADADAFDFTLTSTQSAALYVGSYNVQFFVSKGSKRYMLSSGYVHIKPDIAASQPLAVSGSSPARQRYDKYSELLSNAAYIKTLASDQIAELERTLKRLEWDLKREDDAEKLKRSENVTRKIYTRFITP